MKADGIEPEMPPLSLSHIFDRLMEIGPVEYAGMDRVPLSWAAIREWSLQMVTPLAPWESRLIRRLSAEWLAESRRAVEIDCPPPWLVQTSSNRDAVNRKLAALFG